MTTITGNIRVFPSREWPREPPQEQATPQVVQAKQQTLGATQVDAITCSDSAGDPRQAQRFREAALHCLDDVYTFARFLLRNGTDAEDAVQECYLRALRHFTTFRGPEIKPWLFAILRNVCRTRYARCSTSRYGGDWETEVDEDSIPIWQEPSPTGRSSQ